ncbi:hypothetical protein Hbl1158_12570 [Halobaculum sp. CBA1158]|uniref:hypothetical protein n=1 Tax=Halobaculum sp. CBA1158 TaxID=2904243 RepID=UPI001F44FAD6|nr:hypothetical protein [Halobaculum sp. CBA1158]UIO99353.1 hypothetical protein Hbl1158_12570 [Halobaculum sp. CBA1158]
MSGGPIEPWPSELSSIDAVRGALAGELGGFLALGATLSPAELLWASHEWLVGTGLDPAGAAAVVVACAVARWAVGVSLFATRAVEW